MIAACKLLALHFVIVSATFEAYNNICHYNGDIAIPEGDYYYPTDKCVKITCDHKGPLILGCPEILPRINCKSFQIVGDNSKPYPECCDRIVCLDEKGEDKAD